MGNCKNYCQLLEKKKEVGHNLPCIPNPNKNIGRVNMEIHISSQSCKVQHLSMGLGTMDRTSNHRRGILPLGTQTHRRFGLCMSLRYTDHHRKLHHMSHPNTRIRVPCRGISKSFHHLQSLRRVEGHMWLHKSHPNTNILQLCMDTSKSPHHKGLLMSEEHHTNSHKNHYSEGINRHHKGNCNLGKHLCKEHHR